MATGTIKVDGISDGDSGRKIIQQFGDVPGITGVSFDLETGQVQVEFDADQIALYTTLKTLRDAGFQPQVPQVFPD
ncbi:MAG: heavy-metal-associated domain-containing protein [Azoarcus sp.]|jgi:copper chaperone CopZ|nr:heavy-metal-associated domain-containing protein [Azoarcus sp.]